MERPSFTTGGLPMPLTYIAELALWAVVTAVTWVQARCCRLGIAFLTRGRELAADHCAAHLTGSPGALASALQRLDDERGRPSEDARTWTETAAALDVLPRESAEGRLSLSRTHPSTGERVRRLERLSEELTERKR